MIYHNGSSFDLDGLDDEVRKTTLALKKHVAKFDVIVVRGMSGVIVGVPVSLALKKPLAILRKPNDGSHQGDSAGAWINGGVLKGRALFLDDFTSEGTTRKVTAERVVEQTKERLETCEVTCQFMTRDQNFSSWSL